MPALNQDVVNLVLDLLFWNFDGSVDRHSLAVASRISRLWRVPAQSRLFETVEIQWRRALNSFTHCTSMSSARGRQLRGMVLQLSIVISGHTPVLGVAPAHSLLERDLVWLLPTLPNLYTLSVTSRAASLSASTQRSLSSLKSPRIKSLIIDYIGDPPNRRHRIFFDLLCSLPTVERAMLVGKGTYAFPMGSKVKPRDIPVSLKELRIDLGHSQPCLSGRDLRWLLSHSPESLEILHLYDLVLDPSMSSLMLSLAAQLRSFHVSSSRQSDLKELPNWVGRMTSLQELVIRNDIPSTDCFRVPTDFPRLMGAIPATLQHLGLAVGGKLAFETVRSHIMEWGVRGGGPLAVLTLLWTSEEPLDEQWAALALSPSVRRLRLFYGSHIDVVFSFLTPLLPTATFPRYIEASFRGKIATEDGSEWRETPGLAGFLHKWVKGANSRTSPSM